MIARGSCVYFNSLAMLRSSVLFVLVGILSSASVSVSPLYQEVVTAVQSVEQLRSGTVQYLEALDNEKLKKQRGKWQANADSTQFTFTADFLIYNRKAVKHPLGEVTYRTTVDLKEGKYRYTADSAFFQAYRRNRYSRYVPSRQSAVAWAQAQANLSDKERQRVHQVLDARFQSFREFMQSHSSLTTASPNESDW